MTITMNHPHARFCLSSIALLFATSALSAADDRLPKTREKLAAHQPVKIVCLGDSVTGIYYHTGGRRAYPEMVEIGLRKIDPEVKATVINAGISGHATNNALDRLQKDVLDHKPDLVTVMFGLNDIVRVPKPDFEANLKTIIAKCREIGAEVMLCTENGIYETPGRPIAKLEEYNAAMKAVAEETKSEFCDVYTVYQGVKGENELEFRLLLSDPFHPNMDGHKRNAEAICARLTGKQLSLKDVGPPSPPLAHVRKLIAAGKPVKVYAMTPFDQWIGPALQAAFPNAKVEVTPWKTDGQTLEQLHAAAKEVRGMKPDLVVVATPLDVTPPLSKPAEADIANYSWVMNFALSFGVQEWDVIGISPSVLHAKLSEADADREQFARRLITAQHLDLVARPDGNADEPAAILSKWLKP